MIGGGRFHQGLLSGHTSRSVARMGSAIRGKPSDTSRPCVVEQCFFFPRKSSSRQPRDVYKTGGTNQGFRRRTKFVATHSRSSFLFWLHYTYRLKVFFSSPFHGFSSDHERSSGIGTRSRAGRLYMCQPTINQAINQSHVD